MGHTLASFLKKYNFWLVTHFGVIVMALMLIINSNNWKVLTSYSGYFAVGFFVTVLSLNPLKNLFPKWMFITLLNRHRQELGVATFFYATIHLICFIIKRGGIIKTLPFTLHPAIGPVLLIGYPILFLLAITSNKYSTKKLTFLKWKKLHKMVYIVEATVVIHMILVGQKLWAAILFIPLLTIQFMRKRNKGT